MQQPNELPEWASSYETEINGDSRLVPNKFEPPYQVKQSGIKSKQPVGRQWLNWQFYAIWKWIEYLRDFPAVGDVVSNVDNTNPNIKYGFGTWTSLGTQTIGTTTVYFFKRDS